ncbi:MAG TPA: TonB family protein [Bdellovibrionales bacterium]|nr:TonB family protein [Bdellovibrionales bacterium]
MKRSELYLEHRHNGRLLKALRFESGHAPIFIGSARQSDVRLLGRDIAGVHAVIESQGADWRLSDLGSVSGTYVANGSGEGNVVEHRVDKEAEVRIGQHELRLYVREPRKELFSDDETKQGTHQRIVVKYKGKVINTYVLPRGETFSGVIGGEKVTLAPLSNASQNVKELGDIVVTQSLINPPEVIAPKKFELTQQMKVSAAAIALFILIMVPISFLTSKKAEEEKQPEINQYTKIIYDAKVMQTKRTRAMAISKKSFGNMGQTQPKETTPKDLGASTKVISKIKASGLTQLIGKIAKRAGKSSSWTVATSNDKNPVSGQTFTTTGATASGAGTKAAQGFRIKGVGTSGIAGGGQYKEGAQLNGGTTGNAEVGVVEEESLVDGGLDREVIAAVIRDNLGHIRYCYERQLSAQPDLYGKVQIKFTIGAAGEVTSQQIGSSTLKNAMVEGCILRRVARWKFPNPKGGTSVIVTYPFLFKSLN